jgi:hypothetical protein
MDYIVIPDTAIFTVNRGKKENESNNIVYKDKEGNLHSIDFESCAINFSEEHKDSLGTCVGERKNDEYYFIFYTSGIKTKVVFKQDCVRNIFNYHLLSGLKSSRFQQLHSLINETKYSTRELP